MFEGSKIWKLFNSQVLKPDPGCRVHPKIGSSLEGSGLEAKIFEKISRHAG